MSISPVEQKTSGTASKRPSGSKSKAQQRKERFQLKMRLGLTPGEYKLYRFHEAGKDYPYMLKFITISTLRNEFQGALNDPEWTVVLGNKWLFHLHYSQFGLPLPIGLTFPEGTLRLVSVHDWFVRLRNRYRRYRFRNQH